MNVQALELKQKFTKTGGGSMKYIFTHVAMICGSPQAGGLATMLIRMNILVTENCAILVISPESEREDDALQSECFTERMLYRILVKW